MIKLAEKNICSGCSSCTYSCPQNCIAMVPNKEGFLYPIINEDKCISCKLCMKNCPAINKITPNNNTIGYAAQNKDNSVRLQSSSGGFFTMLAEYVIDLNGVVFGAALDSKLNVKHIYVNTKEDIEKLRGSKYVQSEIGKTYLQTKEFLDNGKTVLFTGTPCQIEGLLRFLGKRYDNLITQDIICHGVPSPKVWKQYLEWNEKKEGVSINNVSFREKTHGWKAFSLNLMFDNGSQKKSTLHQDPFLRSFLSNLCLRPSCYNCAFKGKFRPSDFTLADFWGVHNIIPDIDDDKGTSLVMVNSKKAVEIFSNIQQHMKTYAVDIDTALKYNSAATQPVNEPHARKAFMDEINALTFETTVNKYCPQEKPPSLFSRILRKIKHLK